MSNAQTSAFSAVALICLACDCASAKDADIRRSAETANFAATFRVDNIDGNHGSGFAIGENGLILTCAHVVMESPRHFVAVVGADGVEHVPAEVVAIDPALDLAVLKIDRRFAEVASLEDPAEIRAGQEIYVIGYPYDMGKMVARGHVMQVRHNGLGNSRYGPVRFVDNLTLDVLDGPGTSGAAVFSAETGRVIGVIRMTVTYGDGRSPATNVKMAAPVGEIRRFLDSHHLSYHGAPAHPPRILEDAAEKIYLAPFPPEAPAPKPVPKK